MGQPAPLSNLSSKYTGRNPAIMLLDVYLHELGPHKNLLMEIPSSCTHNGQKLEATKMLLSGRMDKKAVVHSDNGMVFSTDRNCAIKPQKNVEEP